MMSQTDEDSENPQKNGTRSHQSSQGLFAVPTPIKQLFDRFPLATYPVNELPQRAPKHRNTHVLYVFTSDEGALSGLPSYNPACLKWQVNYGLVCSMTLTNHAHHYTAGIPKVLEHRLPTCISDQPCLAKWLPPIHDTCFARAVQANTTSTIWQAAEMGNEQQQEGYRGA
jgi:hypothetical protein